MSLKYRDNIESVAASDSGVKVSPVSVNASAAVLSGGSEGRTEEVERTRVSSLSSVYSGGSLVAGLLAGALLDAGELTGARSFAVWRPLADWVRRLMSDSDAKPCCKIRALPGFGESGDEALRLPVLDTVGCGPAEGG